MARPMNCDVCEEKGADFLVSSTATGETEALCRWCLPLMGDALRTSLIDSGNWLAGEAPSVPMEPPVDASPDGVSPNRSRKRKPKSADGATGESQELAEVAPEAADVNV
jgi:hypothetical protein